MKTRWLALGVAFVYAGCVSASGDGYGCRTGNGEIGYGTFTFDCADDFDPYCDFERRDELCGGGCPLVEQLALGSTPPQIALGATFLMSFESQEAHSNLRSASPDMLSVNGGVCTAHEAGRVALLGFEGEATSDRARYFVLWGNDAGTTELVVQVDGVEDRTIEAQVF